MMIAMSFLAILLSLPSVRRYSLPLSHKVIQARRLTLPRRVVALPDHALERPRRFVASFPCVGDGGPLSFDVRRKTRAQRYNDRCPNSVDSDLWHGLKHVSSARHHHYSQEDCHANDAHRFDTERAF
jgi:hypothetical protein